MNNKSTNSLRISAVTIVKNEEQNIGRWLQSVKHYADEIVVVDTGSTDNTVAIAEAAGARVTHFPWINDFAAAKNFALEQTTGQWIAFFDADEYYSDEDAKKVRPLLERINPRLRTVGVMQKLLNIDRDRHDRLISITYQLRLFRRLPDVKYRGKVHEGLVGIKEKRRDIFMDEELRILHTGYSSSINRQKVARNLEILQAEIPRRGQRPGDDHYLSDCYYGLGDYEKAIEYAKKHIASGIRIAGDETSTHINLITSRYLLEQPTSALLEEAKEAIRLFPCTASFHILIGISYFREKDYLSAAKWLDEGFEVYAKQKNQAELDPITKITGANTGENFLPLACFQRGLIYEYQGNQQKAEEFITASLKEYPYNQEYLSILLRLLANSLSADAIIRELSELYSAGDEVMICQTLQSLINRYPSLTEAYTHFACAANIPADSTLLKIAKEEFTTAAKDAAEELNTACCFGIAAALKTGKPRNSSSIVLYAPAPLKQVWWYLDRGEPIPAKAFASPYVKKLADILRSP